MVTIKVLTVVNIKVLTVVTIKVLTVVTLKVLTVVTLKVLTVVTLKVLTVVTINVLTVVTLKVLTVVTIRVAFFRGFSKRCLVDHRCFRVTASYLTRTHTAHLIMAEAVPSAPSVPFYKNTRCHILQVLNYP